MLLFVALAAILQLNSAGSFITVVHFLVYQNGFAGEEKQGFSKFIFQMSSGPGAPKFPSHKIL